ncbi:hypothetical protein AVEN_163537-1 [Araneus ventricosus]|uniref:Uncharacterized protein n=1 Tax=Araneus ventricosus TaxID=182803 RepID=A0A4Y2BQJ2_ARAVE|nr:hypothetical protein AVEN_163537-1 [Araneus ventricosus]
MEFMFLYWTYPTVVDIQQSSPSYLEAPAISICNPIGYNLTSLCREFEASPCLPPALRKYAAGQICERFPMNCWNGSLPEDYSVIRYNKFTEGVEVQPEDHERLRAKLEDYLNCTIEYAGEEETCNMEYVLGSFYSREELHQYCYTLYSLWGQPEKKRERFPKGAIVKLHFFLNASNREFPDPSDGMFRPKYNLPSSPAIQLALHSPYHLPSPYLEGNNFLVGRSYEIRLTMSEKHLLPAPYQTNCTNYLEEWKLRGGKAPINQMDVVQECRMKRYYEGIGCVPIDVDYPHEHPICKMCPEEKCNYSTEVKSSVDSCQDLGEQYNQPCDSISYAITKEQKVISFLEEVSLELFSVIGGYLGMWLGISLVTVYDFLGSIIGLIHKYSIKLSHKRKQEKVRGYPPYDRRYGKNFRSTSKRDFMA